MGKWKTCTIAEIGTVVGGATPSTKINENYIGGKIPWITPKDLANCHGRFISHGKRNITEKGLHSCSAQIMPKHTVLFSSRAPIGYTAIADVPLCTNQGFKSVIPNPEIDFLFLYYLLTYNKDRIENVGSGTTFKEISAAAMKNIPIRIPVSTNEQRKIAKILSVLDDKIENNNVINKNLLEQAQAIFNQEFLALDDIPADWAKSSLLGIADYLNGLAMQKYRPTAEEQGIPVLKIKELRQGSCDANSEFCSPSIKPEYIIYDGDVIFSWSGSLLIDFWCSGKCGLNQHLFKVTSKTYNKWFYYAWTNHHLQKFAAIAADMATTMGHIKREELAKAEVLIPSPSDYERISNLFAPLYDLVISNRIENRKLTSLRDELLPSLMTGQLDVSEALQNA